MSSRIASSLVAAALPFVLVGCGDDDPAKGEDASASSSEDEVRALGEAYLEALRTGDPSVCGRMTDDYAKKVARDGGSKTCEETVQIYADWYADSPGEWEKEFGTEVRSVEVDGDRATLVLGNEAGDGQALLIVREGDAWLIDAPAKQG